MRTNDSMRRARRGPRSGRPGRGVADRRDPRGWLALGTIAVLLAVASPAGGQARGDGAAGSGGGPSEPLTLDAAVRRATERNLAIRLAAARVEERVGEARHAARRVPSNPVLSGSVARRRGTDEGSTDVGVSLSQELWIGGQRGLRKRAASRREEGARQELAFLRRAVAARARRAFLEVLVADEAVDTARRVAEVAAEVARYAESRLRAGEATLPDLNTARIGLGQARAALIASRRQARTARLGLAEVLSVDPAVPLEVQGRLAPVPLDVPDRERLLTLAARRRQDLAAAAARVVAAREELRLSRRLLIPNLTVMGFYEREEGSDDIAGGGISVPLPIFHRFGGEREVASARLRQRRLEQHVLRLDVRREVLRALVDYEAARERVSILSADMLERAEENVGLTETAFREGKVGAPALATAQDRLADVRGAYVDAQRELVRAATALERGTAGLLVLQSQPARP